MLQNLRRHKRWHKDSNSWRCELGDDFITQYGIFIYVSKSLRGVIIRVRYFKTLPFWFIPIIVGVVIWQAHCNSKFSRRGEGAPSPIYEGEDSVIARILDGKKANYKVPLPKKGESKKAILETYTKEYSAEYQSQALIDLARGLSKKIIDNL